MQSLPDPPELKEARALWLANRFAEALARFEAVLVSHPDHPLALLDAARAYGASYQIRRAEELLDRYLALGRERTNLILAGQSYRMISRGVKARQCLAEARAMGPLEAVPALELAMLHDRAGDRPAALQLLDETLAREPEFAEGRFFRAEVQVRQGAGDLAVPVLEELASDARQPVYLRTRAAYALAEAADRRGDAAAAFREARRAKKLGSEGAAVLRQASTGLRLQAKQLAGVFTRSRLAGWKNQDRPLPDRSDPPVVLLTGSPRSGSTLLEKVLDAHPGLVSSDEHDLFARFMGPGLLHPGGVPSKDASARLLAASPELVRGKRQEYLDRMEQLIGEPIGARVFLDKNPSVTELVPAWLRIAPQSKILVMVRDPRDVVVSCFLNPFPLNAYTVDFLTIEQTAARYQREMNYWLKIRPVLPPEQWREVRYEDCVADLAGTTREVIEWLGLEWSEKTLEYRDGLSRRLTNSPTYADIQQPIYAKAIGRWQRYAEELKPVQAILAPLVQRLGYA